MTEQTNDLEALREQIEQTKSAVANLEADLLEAREELTAAENASPGEAFDDYLSGAAQTPADVAHLRSTVEHLQRLTEAGHERVTALLREIRRLEDIERQRIEASMTFDDAVAFARDGLKAIDLRGIRRELETLEATMKATEKERLQYVPLIEEAAFQKASAARRGQDDRYVEADESHQELVTKLRDARDRAVAAREQHGHTRNGLRSACGAAFRHVTRLLNAHADGLEQQAKSVRFLGEGLSNGRASCDQPAQADSHEPPYDAILRLAKQRAPILELTCREPPEGRPETDLMPRSASYSPSFLA